MASGITVHGIREFSILCTKAGPAAVKLKNETLRKVAEPTRQSAQSFAERGIPRIGPRWGKMRVGVTRTLVYVAPVKRGVKSGPRRRPRFAQLMEDRAMTPARRANEGQIEANFRHAFFDEFPAEWNRREL